LLPPSSLYPLEIATVYLQKTVKHIS